MESEYREEIEYEAPTVEVVGSVYDVTGDINKQFNSSDGLTFMGIPIGNASP